MEHHIRVNILSGAAVLAAGVVLSLVTSTWVASRAYQKRFAQVAERDQTITVKGSARLRITSDLAVWHISVRGDGKTLVEAYEVLQRGIEGVQAFLNKQGFTPPTVEQHAIQTEERYVKDKDGKDTSETAGYTLRRTFSVTTPETQRVAGAAGEVTGLIKDGIYVISGSPAYYYSKLPDLKIQIMGDASKDARSRADEIVGKAGSRVGELRSAQMGVLQITQPNSTDVSGSGIYDTSTILKDVQAVVTLTFAVSGE
jgi:hypothetical protein